MSEIDSLDALREIYPPPKQRSLDKEVDQLDVHCVEFIARSPFVVIASAAADGSTDVSPKGGPPGFVRVLDERRLAIPDATGNRRLDSLQNFLENPQIALLFMIPGLGETLRVNGTVALNSDPELLRGMETRGKDPKLALIVSVECAYIHCAKALMRSQLWDPESWPEPATLPSAAVILNDHIGIGDVELSAAQLKDSYTNNI